MGRMAADFGMSGAKAKRGRTEASPAVEMVISRHGEPGFRPKSNTTSTQAGQIGLSKTKVYHVVAIRKDVAYTRFGDHDPEGALFVLAED